MHRPKTPLVTVIIPVYDEARRVTQGLKTITNYLRHQSFSWEIIVVNDGSTDATTKLMLPLMRELPCHLISTAKNYGKGHAVRLGVAAASGQHIFFTDIDASVSPSYIKPFLGSLRHKDVVIGSRRLRDSKIIKSQAHVRQSLGHGFTKLCNVVLGLNHTDYTCGFKGFRGHVAKKLFAQSRINRWAFDPEIVFLADTHHYSVKELPVTWKNDPQTKVNLLLSIITSFLDLLRIRLRLRH